MEGKGSFLAFGIVRCPVGTRWWPAALIAGGASSPVVMVVASQSRAREREREREQILASRPRGPREPPPPRSRVVTVL